MRILMVGAGCVGAVLTRALEKTKSNDITYVVRDGKKSAYPRMKLLDLKTEEIQVRERPSVVQWSDKMPNADWVIFAVRGDQLDEALKLLERVSPTAKVAIAAAAMDALPRARALLADRKAVLVLPTFMAWKDADVIKWWVPPIVKTIISSENDSEAEPLASELGAMLTGGGVPSRAVPRAQERWEEVLALGIPVLAALELAEWDFSRFARNGELRKLAARSSTEALRTVNAKLTLPAPLLAMTLRASGAVPRMFQDLWKSHGPKVAQQTRMMLDDIVARAATRGLDVSSLSQLRQRLT